MPFLNKGVLAPKCPSGVEEMDKDPCSDR